IKSSARTVQDDGSPFADQNRRGDIEPIFARSHPERRSCQVDAVGRGASHLRSYVDPIIVSASVPAYALERNRSPLDSAANVDAIVIRSETIAAADRILDRDRAPRRVDRRADINAIVIGADRPSDRVEECERIGTGRIERRRQTADVDAVVRTARTVAA